MYGELVKRHNHLKNAYAKCREQTSAVAKDLERLKRQFRQSEKDANELADIIKRKEAEMKDKDHEIIELRKQVESCRRDGPQDEATTNHERPAIRDLSIVHSRYQAVRAAMEKEKCSLSNAFRFAGISRSTVRDFTAIAELKVVDKDAYESILRDFSRRPKCSVKEIEEHCRRKLANYLSDMSKLRSEMKLLPFKFEERFYE